MSGFLILVGVVIAWLGYAARQIEKRRLPEKLSRFADRESLSPDIIYQRYFNSKMMIRVEEFIPVWQEIGALAKLDPEKLRPSDRFKVELTPVSGHLVEDELIDLEDMLRRKLRRKGAPLPKEPPQNLEEYICILLGP